VPNSMIKPRTCQANILFNLNFLLQEGLDGFYVRF
jgi:hypothetical protein